MFFNDSRVDDKKPGPEFNAKTVQEFQISGENRAVDFIAKFFAKRLFFGF